MADQIQRAKKVTVKVDTGDGSGLQTLGECLDMAQVVDRGFYYDVPGDRHGGPQGPPIDRQFLGRVINVRVEMSRWDRTVADQVIARLAANGAALQGTVQSDDIGELMIQDGSTFRVLLSSANNPRNFPTCILSEPVEVGEGTKFSALLFEFEAHRNQTTGVIENSVNS